MVNVENMKLLKKDVVLKLKKKSEVEQSRFILKEDATDNTLQYFTVLGKSDEVTMVNVGDVVLCSWTRITPPFEVSENGSATMVGVTSEDELVAVLEG